MAGSGAGFFTACVRHARVFLRGKSTLRTAIVSYRRAQRGDGSGEVGLYVTDPHTDAILYMNKFMKDVFKLEHPEGEDLLAGAAIRMNGRCPFCPVDRLMADANQNQSSVEEAEHADVADL